MIQNSDRIVNPIIGNKNIQENNKKNQVKNNIQDFEKSKNKMMICDKETIEETYRKSSSHSKKSVNKIKSNTKLFLIPRPIQNNKK